MSFQNIFGGFQTNFEFSKTFLTDFERIIIFQKMFFKVLKEYLILKKGFQCFGRYFEFLKLFLKAEKFLNSKKYLQT